MSDIDQTAPPDEDCVSRKPWAEVLSRSAKLFVFRAAGEGGRSIGRIVFFVLLALIVLGLGAWALNAATGWFEGLFDFWPFGSGDAASETEEQGGFLSRFGFGGEEDTAPAPVEDESWFCRVTPIC